jgi:hypothetical protein
MLLMELYSKPRNPFSCYYGNRLRDSRQACRLVDKQTDRQTDGQTDRQADKYADKPDTDRSRYLNYCIDDVATIHVL